jgi:hypothetical protein
MGLKFTVAKLDEVPETVRSMYKQEGTVYVLDVEGVVPKERIDELLQDHSYCIESTTITTVPLYHLEPHTKVFVRDDKTNVCGEYMVSKVTVPFAYNGTMSLNANKIVSNIM